MSTGNGSIFAYAIDSLNVYFQGATKFTLLSNEMKPLHFTGSFVPVPFLPGHDYVLIPGVKDGILRTTYCTAVPDCLQDFAYSVQLCQPEVSVYC